MKTYEVASTDWNEKKNNNNKNRDQAIAILLLNRQHLPNGSYNLFMILSWLFPRHWFDYLCSLLYMYKCCLVLITNFEFSRFVMIFIFASIYSPTKK